ncbi:hypothetical protein C2S53_014032 [Perilla frutescens var. hirtella]|uniref:Uncharacterized protein n=1 Tax=Perilla frutescens var. hirtella TaxID=608512 RepID=A0AAD4IS47_PERFH|nr:hypothetical protein C2S53_014032 [Perilla frutescens var. hirtella]
MQETLQQQISSVFCFKYRRILTQQQSTSKEVSLFEPLSSNNPAAIEEGDNNPSQGFRDPSMRLEVPIFDGEDPYSWVFQIEEYFSFHKVLESQRLQIFAFHLDGKASLWFQWLMNNGMIAKIT